MNPLRVSKGDLAAEIGIPRARLGKYLRHQTVMPYPLLARAHEILDGWEADPASKPAPLAKGRQSTAYDIPPPEPATDLPTVDADPGCVHHWVIEAAETRPGPYSLGACRKCGGRRAFSNSYASESWMHQRDASARRTAKSRRGNDG